jgi:hypothetical protein
MFYIYAQMYAYKALENCTRVQWGAVGCSRACGVGAVKFAWDHKRGGPLSVGCGAAKDTIGVGCSGCSEDATLFTKLKLNGRNFSFC